MAYKPLYDWMDKHEGREGDGNRIYNMNKDKKHIHISNEDLDRSQSPFVVGHPVEKSVHRQKKKAIAGKMQSKEYKTIRCGHCGKFGHHHSSHK